MFDYPLIDTISLYQSNDGDTCDEILCVTFEAPDTAVIIVDEYGDTDQMPLLIAIQTAMDPSGIVTSNHIEGCWINFSKRASLLIIDYFCHYKHDMDLFEYVNAISGRSA
jgi:hypothetical protein